MSLSALRRAHYSAKHVPASWDFGPRTNHPHDPRNEDDGLTDCPVCDAKGWRMVLDDDNKPIRVECEACEGARYLDENGLPVKD